jgi:hypothetical protein
MRHAAAAASKGHTNGTPRPSRAAGADGGVPAIVFVEAGRAAVGAVAVVARMAGSSETAWIIFGRTGSCTDLARATPVGIPVPTATTIRPMTEHVAPVPRDRLPVCAFTVHL